MLNAAYQLQQVFPYFLGLEYTRVAWEQPQLNRQLAASQTPLELFSRFYQETTQEEMTPEEHEVIRRILSEIQEDGDVE